MKKPYEFEIKARYAGLRMSERKVADTYLSWDKDFEELSLAALAEKAGVSQPSVMRFVKAMGFDGFKEFKYAILKARGEQEAIGEDEKNSAGFPPPLVYGYAISEGDSLEEMPGRIISQAVSCLGDTLKQISSEKIQKAAEMICSARQIAAYYVENSASVAQDLVTKLLYLGFNCMMYSDIYLQEIRRFEFARRGFSYWNFSFRFVKKYCGCNPAGQEIRRFCFMPDQSGECIDWEMGRSSFVYGKSSDALWKCYFFQNFRNCRSRYDLCWSDSERL